MLQQIEMDFTAAQLRDQGIKRAVEKANKVEPGWSDQAYEIFKQFLSVRYQTFMIEDFRQYAIPMGLPKPPSDRAFGYIAIKAKKEGLIHRVGYGKTNSKTAHKTPAAIWSKTMPNG
ncbi:hypothetical protein Pan5_45 [Pseudanabaena phage Pan5]|nr:hypothetical protein Pan5_45 [Pseudanabaena phage Pan5]